MPSFSKRCRRVTVVVEVDIEAAAAALPCSPPFSSSPASSMTPDHAPEIPLGAPGSLVLASGDRKEENIAQGVHEAPETTTKKSVAGGGGGRNGERRSFFFFPPLPLPPFSPLVAIPIPKAEKNARLAAWTASFSK